MKVGIVNYSIGNVGSVYSAFQFYRYDVRLVSHPKELDAVDMIVLAGVGNFTTAVHRLKTLDFWDSLNESVQIKKKPLLGICLGMQLFGDVSYEDGENAGFGWIKGRVEKIQGEALRLPHMGWNAVAPINDGLFRGIRSLAFYFMHSYRFIPEETEVVAATTQYGSSSIVSSIRKDHIVGVQFHPEKSQGDGLRFLKNVVETLA
ncbi:MAG: imidazole glycerol phosphate synthase subunit HisH [Nitrospiria bacterium]